ncbi:hypothetical protein ACHQM5_000283 [Ranunculus cassubicifolius]
MEIVLQDQEEEYFVESEEERERLVSQALFDMSQETLDHESAMLLRATLGNPPPIPEIQKLVGRCAPPYHKGLTESDVNDHLDRLLIQKSFAMHNINPMLRPSENVEDGIDVTVYDHRGRKYAMQYKLWCRKYYVLTKKWRAYREANKLQRGVQVTVWAFRRAIYPDDLCFAISF